MSQDLSSTAVVIGALRVKPVQCIASQSREKKKTLCMLGNFS